ncbi:MAG: hypothetical protein HMLIMOIP_002088 [Candidatus Nitrosomirales archaeon]|jgi:hypothetical protein
MTQPFNNLSSSDVSKIHAKSDIDSSVTAQHHTLGIEHNQASPGDHIHNGKSSKRIGKGLDPTFPTTANAVYTQAQIQSIIDALRDLGFGT